MPVDERRLAPAQFRNAGGLRRLAACLHDNNGYRAEIPTVFPLMNGI